MRKVKLNFGITDAHHSVYEDLINYPPEGYEYEIYGIKKNFIIEALRPIYNLFKMISKNKISNLIHNELLKSLDKKSLIHFCNFVPKISNKFVADLEGIYSFLPFSAFHSLISKKETIYEYLDYITDLIAQENCITLMPFSNFAKNEIFNLLNLEYSLRKKFITVYRNESRSLCEKKSTLHTIMCFQALNIN